MPNYDVEVNIVDANKDFILNFQIEDKFNQIFINGKIDDESVFWYLKNTMEGSNVIGSHLVNDNIDSEHIKDIKVKLIQSGGKHKSKNHKRRTPEKVEINKKVKAVFVGPKGGKYIRKNGKYVPLKKLV